MRLSVHPRPRPSTFERSREVSQASQGMGVTALASTYVHAVHPRARRATNRGLSGRPYIERAFQVDGRWTDLGRTWTATNRKASDPVGGDSIRRQP